MKRRDGLRLSLAWIVAVAAGAALAQVDPADAGADRPWADGEVRRLDPGAGKITLRHGEIAELDMPPMTMVFHVRDPGLLQGLQVGMRVRFRAQKHQGAYVVTEIKPAP
jgi:Cu(I)/Ag(I) efflux system protein CusF